MENTKNLSYSVCYGKVILVIRMCGFCGFSGPVPNSDGVLAEMLKKIIHRGPDSHGVYLGEGMNLGFRRLAVIGVEDGEQPLYNEDRNLVLVFNGEIYNHRDLRKDLSKKGHVFRSGSDAETVLHLYEEYGRDMFRHLRGMFAFALYNIREKTLFAARDHYGIKPLYYTKTGSGLIFGSEIKCFYPHPDFVPKINHKALESYLTFHYSVLDETFFQGVFKLPPGHYLTFCGGNLEVKRYNTYVFTPGEMTLEKAASLIDQAVLDTVSKHMESEVEVGAFLSGGVDSSYIASVFGGKKTFTVGFNDDKDNETVFAKELSDELGLVNISKKIDGDEFFDKLGAVQYHMDEPFADPSAVALYILGEMTSKHVKVALSGEGADVLFGGNNIYREFEKLSLYRLLPRSFRLALGELALSLPKSMSIRPFLLRGAKTLEERYIGGVYIFSPDEKRELLKESRAMQKPQDITAPYFQQVKNEDSLTKMQYLDFNLWLVGNILKRADKMSMAHSLEVRVPFLDRRVFSIASRIPPHLRVGRKGTKLAFREAARKHLPKNSAARKKLGFPVPIDLWLREKKYHDIVKSYFESDTAKMYFNKEVLLTLLASHKKTDVSSKIWTVFMFLVWHGEFFGR